MKRRLLISALSLSVILTIASSQPGATQMSSRSNANASATQDHPYVGMWVTADGHIRHELLPNGRYIEARGTREKAYQGRYEVSGDHIEYWDDTGFTADGDFIDGVLHHAGMVLYRDGHGLE